MAEQAFGVFDFGLNDDQERRARRLHDESLILDLMYWGPNSYLDWTQQMDNELQAHLARHANPLSTLWRGFEQPGEWSLAGQFPSYYSSWADSGVNAGHFPLQIGTEEWLLRTTAHATAVIDGHSWIRKVLS